MTNLHSIKVKNYSDVFEEFTATAVAITPGTLLEMDSNGHVQAHSTAGGNVLPPMFALEDELQGNDIEDNYAASAKVQVWIPGRGDQVLAILADGQNVSVGDALESNGAGYLQAHVADVESFESAEAGSITVYPNQIVGVALEARDLSGSSGEETESGTVGLNTRIKVRIV